MKRTLFGIATMITSTAALAVVADKFKCDLEVTDLETKNRVIANDEFFVSRLPAGPTADSTIQITEANAGPSVSLDSKKATYGVSLYIGYSHAVKFNALGQPMEASQKSCLSISASYCKKEESHGDSDAPCSSVKTMDCPSTTNNGPFGPNSSWRPVPLLDGVPLFNGDALTQMESFILDKNRMVVGFAKVNWPRQQNLWVHSGVGSLPS